MFVCQDITRNSLVGLLKELFGSLTEPQKLVWLKNLS